MLISACGCLNDVDVVGNWRQGGFRLLRHFNIITTRAHRCMKRAELRARSKTPSGSRLRVVADLQVLKRSIFNDSCFHMFQISMLKFASWQVFNCCFHMFKFQIVKSHIPKLRVSRFQVPSFHIFTLSNNPRGFSIGSKCVHGWPQHKFHFVS